MGVENTGTAQKHIYIFLCTYISINIYATITLGTAIIDSVSLSREEIADKDELFFPKLAAAELLIHISYAASCSLPPSFNLYPSFISRMQITGTLKDYKDRGQHDFSFQKQVIWI